MKTKTALYTPTKLLTTTHLFYAVIFALPMITHGPQLLIGTAVNTILFIGASKLKNKELILLAVLPSLGALTNGVLFGSLTMLLVYFAPTIWISNYLLMTTFKKATNLPSLLKISLASLAKATLLFIFAFTLFKLNIVPSIFLTAMGSIQLATAIAGGLIALSINKLVIK